MPGHRSVRKSRRGVVARRDGCPVNSFKDVNLVTFVSEISFNKFFQFLRDGKLAMFRSEMDVKFAPDL
jgi:hypothetical protein